MWFIPCCFVGECGVAWGEGVICSLLLCGGVQGGMGWGRDLLLAALWDYPRAYSAGLLAGGWLWDFYCLLFVDITPLRRFRYAYSQYPRYSVPR